jgi:epoxyqueuosine reductase
MTSDEIVARLGERGWRAAVVPADRLDDLSAEIERRRGEIAPAVRDVVDRNLELAVPTVSFPVRSLIVVAVRHACARATFVVEGEELVVPIPTTYCNHDAIQTHVAAALADDLRLAGLTAAKADLPEKLLAVCSGVARYGTNNIAYVEGWGSFVELVTFVSDVAPGDHTWRVPQRISRCGSCSACVKACPTGAIDGLRFLLHGERCLTLHNESEAPFADWIDPSWHHCLVGCLRCQWVCPDNLDVRERVAETAAFDEHETDLLQTGVTHEQLTREARLRDKLGDLGLLEYDDLFLGVLLPRNLKAVVRARQRGSGDEA